jgi:hypothetical protein
LRLRHSIRIPIATRKAAPAILTTVYAVAEAASTAAKPSTVNAPQTASPATTPTAARAAAVPLPANAKRVTTATSGPGNKVNSASAPTAATYEANMPSVWFT